VVVEHLTKRFGERVAFDDVSFEVGYAEDRAVSGNEANRTSGATGQSWLGGCGEATIGVAGKRL